MRPLALAAIQAGLIDEDVIAQFKRWGMVPRTLDTTVREDPDLAIERIQFALEAEEQVRLQSTDLDILRYWMDKSNQQRGQIVIVDARVNTKATKTVLFALRRHGARTQFILPWISENITEILTNGHTYLRYDADGQNKKVFFTDVEEMYFGDTKAFLVCSGLEDGHVGRD